MGGANATGRIAIDGPAASGKSAVGSAVARRLSIPFIDTGAIYRALTWLALEEGIAVTDAPALVRLAASATIVLGPETDADSGARTVLINGRDATPHLRSAPVEAAVSPVSAVPEVRAHLIAIQRSLAGGCCVMAGRDIGTVVLPNAELKVYLDASPEERARRRRDEIASHGGRPDYDTLDAGLRERDLRDSSRQAAPLRAAADAVRLLTDSMSLTAVIEHVLLLAQERGIYRGAAPMPAD